MKAAKRFDDVELSLIRQITALATPDSINLSIGEPNVEPDEHFRELGRRAAAEGSWHYTPNAGAPSLRRKLIESQVLSLDPATEVCITAGTQEGLYAVMQAFVNPGDEVLVPDPGFLAYPTLVTLADGRPRSYALDPESWTLDLAEIEKKIGPRTRAILVNSPSNPTGSVESDETLQQLARLADERDILLISDEVYREIWYERRPGTLAGRGRNVIVAGGMSKSHSMTGLRLGWLLARSELMSSLIKAHQYIATCASAFSQALAELVLDNPNWNRHWLEKIRGQFEAQRAAALSAIEREIDHRIRPPAGAFYAFVPIPACESITAARTMATREGVLTVPGVAFGKSGEGFLRISYAASIPDIEEGIRRIARFFEQVQ